MSSIAGIRLLRMRKWLSRKNPKRGKNRNIKELKPRQIVLPLLSFTKFAIAITSPRI